MKKDRNEAMIVAPQPEAVEAGAAILADGGNAIDAAIACAFVQTVVDPFMCGIAGFGSMAAYLPQRGFHGYYDFPAPAPKAARPDMWEPLLEGEARDGFGFLVKGHVNEIGYESICVPAALRAFFTAHREFGSIPWAEVVAPAIEWARRGWSVRTQLHQFWSDPGSLGHAANRDRVSFTNAAAELYCRPDGSPKRLGDIVMNRDYAEVLATIAGEGPDPFYTGDLARTTIDDIAGHGGHLGLDDLAEDNVRCHEPLWSTYRRWSVSTNRPPNGGVKLVQMLNVLENFDLRAMGHNSAEYVRVVSEAMKKATADKDRYIGDPAFLDVPLDRLTSKEYARTVAEKIGTGEKFTVPRIQAASESADTTHLSVIDRHGNCVAMTHSLGLPSGVVTPGMGFMHNGCMSGFDPRPGQPGSIAPGKARFSSMCPSMVFDDGEPMLVLGAPGGANIATGVLQVVLNVLDFDIPISEAVALPRFYATSDVIDVVNRIPRAVQSALEARGHEVARSPDSYGFALVHGLARQGDQWRGGADPGGDGMAMSASEGT